MTPIWFEHNEEIYDLAKLIKISCYGKFDIRFYYSISEHIQIAFGYQDDRDVAFERIKTILDKIY